MSVAGGRMPNILQSQMVGTDGLIIARYNPSPATSKRQQIITAIKNLVEADTSIVDASDTEKIQLVNGQVSKTHDQKPGVNYMDIWCPDDEEASYESQVGKIDNAFTPVLARIFMPNHNGDNDHVYLIMQNFQSLMWANHRLGLSFVSNVHVDEDAPRVKPRDPSLADGCIIRMRVFHRMEF